MAKIASSRIVHGMVVDGQNVIKVFEAGDEVKGLSDAEIAALGSAVTDVEPEAKPKVALEKK